MKVQAEISIYPLRTKNLSKPINDFCGILYDHGLEIKTTAMSTLVKGESGDIFDACSKAFEKMISAFEIVMTMKVSNACPLDKD